MSSIPLGGGRGTNEPLALNPCSESKSPKTSYLAIQLYEQLSRSLVKPDRTKPEESLNPTTPKSPESESPKQKPMKSGPLWGTAETGDGAAGAGALFDARVEGFPA